MTLKVPSYAQSKAFYLQPAMPVLCLAFVFGTERLLAALGRLRAVLLAALGTCAAVFFFTVWVRPAAPAAQVQAGYLALAAGDAASAEQKFRQARERDPAHAGALVGFATIRADREDCTTAADAATRALAQIPPDTYPKLTARALNVSARCDLAAGRTDAAERALRRALALAPAERQNYRPLVWLLLEQGRPREAVEVLRDQLWLDPANLDVHQLLSELERRKASR
jgi:type IV pilus assembly protein PilF